MGGVAFASGGSLKGHRKLAAWSRVIVVGANGAGKTWFAGALAAQTGAVVIHKDALALTTGWRQRPRSEIQAALLRAVAAECWVLEGGPSVLTTPVLARATHVVWLDPPAALRGWRVLRRSLRYLGRTRPEHPPGNRDWPGLRQFRFLWRALVDGDRFAAAITAALEGASVPAVRLTRTAEVSALIKAAGEGAEGF